MNKFPLEPFGNKLIVEPLEKKEEKLDNGIIAPASVNAELREGKVIAVSKTISNLVNPGDIILYPERKGIGQVVEGKYYVWLDATKEKEELWGIVSQPKFSKDNNDSL